MSSSSSRSFDPQLTTIWDTLGLSYEEKIEASEKYDALIEQAHIDFYNSTLEMRDRKIQEYNDLKAQYVGNLQALCLTDFKVKKLIQMDEGETWNDKINAIKTYYKQYENKYNTRYAVFADLHEQISSLFDQIGYEAEDRGEFANIEDGNLSKDREARYKERISQLEEEVNERLETLNTLTNQINSVSKEIGETISEQTASIFETKNISNKSFNYLTDILEELMTTKEERLKVISLLAVEIAQLWDLLDVDQDVRDKFIKNHNNFELWCIEDCQREQEKLKQQLEDRMPEIIQKLKITLSSLCEQLHYTLSQKRNVFSMIDDPKDDYETYQKYDNQINNLRSRLVLAQPIISFIEQREEIKKDYNNRNENYQGAKLDKIVRRYKTVLPQVEKKLKINLLRYKSTTKEEFLWNGKPILKELENIELTQLELRHATTLKKSTIKSK